MANTPNAIEVQNVPSLGNIADGDYLLGERVPGTTVRFQYEANANGMVNTSLVNQLAWYSASGNTVTGLSILASAVLTNNAAGIPLWLAYTGTGSPVLNTSPTLITPLLGTPTSGILTNCTGLPNASVVGLGTLATQSGTFSGTSSGTNTGDQTNISGNAATVTTNANLTGPVTSTGNATAIANGAISNAMLANGAVANLSGTNTGDQVTATTPTASTIAKWDASVNLSANNFLEGYTSTATATGTTTLTVTSTEQQVFTGTLAQICLLPVVSTLAIGAKYIITNLSTLAVTVQSSGANAIQVMAAKTTLIVQSNATSGTGAAVWNVIAYFAAASDITGSGLSVRQTSPTLVTPALGTPSALVLTNATGLPAAGGGTGLSIQPPAFSAHVTSTQSITAVTFTKVALATKVFDTNSNFDAATNYRFTPTVAGKYLITGAISYNAMVTATPMNVYVFKNGSGFAEADAQASGTGQQGTSINTIVQMNGSTDYVELYVYQGAVTTETLNVNTFMAGFWIGA